ncbi:hypothetical protein DKAM_0703 [Desulfurococcus amylolyticus 1221n]|uniref:Uncharacterized protein n=1 Tax=Desulfurococcus amylolyticus (strain DSM 18924 / JCM 16383 / VKM B-2413 / 1221n) TaxID=490899 RepID=B8D4J8_DESA1|nr:hypothetical protein [Desulfurococcus amylolyticus]ACL11029.1 hypothetical protein DKAM_0703 [Desulfurococcus amylolyticus 1221n]
MKNAIACINLFLNSRCRVLANTPKPDASPSRIQGNKDEVMTPVYINLYET